jgi:hypothetical protein
VVSYRVMPGVPGELVRFVSGLLAAHHREIGARNGPAGRAAAGRRCSRWPGPGTKAISPRLAGGSGLAQSTAWQ